MQFKLLLVDGGNVQGLSKRRSAVRMASQTLEARRGQPGGRGGGVLSEGAGGTHRDAT